MKRVNPFDWKQGFPDAMKAGGFDCIIGNPPWGAALGKVERDYLGPKHPEVADFESSQYFLGQALTLLNSRGVLGMIVPNTFALNVHAKKCRDHLVGAISIESVLDLSEVDVFSSPSVRSIVVICSRDHHGPCAIARFVPKTLGAQELRSATQQQFHDAHTWKELLAEDTPRARIASRLVSSATVLANYCEVRQGYIPYRTTTLAHRHGKVKAEEIVRERLWHARSKVNSSYQRELQGADVGRYSLNWSGVWVHSGEWVSTYLPLSVFSGQRVLVREITGQFPRVLSATYTDETYVHNPSVLAVLPRAGALSPKFVVAILNSRLMSVLFTHVAPKAKKGLFPKIIITDARRLPFPRIDLGERSQKLIHDRMVGLADSMLSLHRALAASPGETQGRVIQSQIEATDEEIDRLVYEMYGLTTEEIADHQGKRMTHTASINRCEQTAIGAAGRRECWPRVGVEP